MTPALEGSWCYSNLMGRWSSLMKRQSQLPWNQNLFSFPPITAALHVVSRRKACHTHVETWESLCTVFLRSSCPGSFPAVSPMRWETWLIWEMIPGLWISEEFRTGLILAALKPLGKACHPVYGVGRDSLSQRKAVIILNIPDKQIFSSSSSLPSLFCHRSSLTWGRHLGMHFFF